ncbi:UDP-N-acetylglucosamine 2-epimerase (non-hydrolyzing) [Spirosoma sp. BT702]|uniref:UDP-N-acetylglucosamine 2-epimerase (Non-hydrolyzing) n=1 Tax=Spirosoma profusum TaxID=2771354 RepID=A0A927AUR8_9BACT|nr:UDP-N-acetylglucosamine 2-epimerase (non-hydrolyzing) [Spirosoma profusum]MBD2704795.1 UDP-N-acetylglucosamine 2-epimerase (non-hydrolyzing) [Spirosoma profusum]
MKILNVVGARPNFIKIAPLHRAFGKFPDIDSKIVHTGQHYDASMSDVFFAQLDLPKPDFYLDVVNGSQTRQMADIMLKFEHVLTNEKPDWVLVVGDITSTLACALVAVRMGIRVAHVEAGLRSGDRQMPEEINRIVTDSLSDLLLVTEPAGRKNLLREGVAEERIHLVGNVMIDALVHHRPKASALNIVDTLGLSQRPYAFMTMHRPANVDTLSSLQQLISVIERVAQQLPVVFSLHPRTHANLVNFNILPQLISIPNTYLLKPQGYLESLNLIERAAIVLTDSGGIQEETTYLNIPCLTLRTSTERPITIELGTNQLIPELNPELIAEKVIQLLNNKPARGTSIPFWDGRAAERIADIIRAS